MTVGMAMGVRNKHCKPTWTSLTIWTGTRLILCVDIFVPYTSIFASIMIDAQETSDMEPTKLDDYDDFEPINQSKTTRILARYFKDHIAEPAEEDMPKSVKEGEAANGEGDQPKKKPAKKRARSNEGGEQEPADKSKKARTAKVVSIYLPIALLSINDKSTGSES